MDKYLNSPFKHSISATQPAAKKNPQNLYHNKAV